MKKRTLILESKRSEVHRVEQFLTEINEAENILAMDRMINLHIAASEAVINAIVHGNKEDTGKKVTVEVEWDGGISITVRDEGEGYSPKEVPDPTAPENLLAESGRGLLIIRSLVDDYQCNATDKGTTVKLSINK